MKQKKLFKLVSNYKPTGDQPQAIHQLVKGLKENKKNQVLLGVTGSGKTFTIANVIKEMTRPVIVLSHTKTLASQLYSELKEYFPENRVEYFVSYFDYYRPEAYLPMSDTFIDKTSKSNWDLEAMRMSTFNALTLRPDTIVVASVAAIYGSSNPKEYRQNILNIEVGMKIEKRELLIELVKRAYSRNDLNNEPGSFCSKGDVIELSPSWTRDFFIRIELFGNQIENIAHIDTLHKTVKKRVKNWSIFPSSEYAVKRTIIEKAVATIKVELKERLKEFSNQNKLLEKQRLQERVLNDIDSLEEFGFTPGIENYARHIDGRNQGERPYTLFDHISQIGCMILDESHMMIPQLKAMYKGDYSRKKNLVDYGFRLPSALDNRPLKFAEFETAFDFNKIFISATPSDYEIDKTNGEIVQQIIRPTGLLDPIIEIRSSTNQVENIFDELQKQKQKNERTLILTITKRISEEFARYFQKKGEKITYIHSDHTTFERNEILRKLRKGILDTIIGINLLREGIDLPEVSLVIVLDANKESFFRNQRSLIQIVGRSARNVNGRVIFYANNISKSMQATINDNKLKREIQSTYNLKHGIIPQSIIKPIPDPIKGHGVNLAIEEFLHGKTKKAVKEQKQALIEDLRIQMHVASEKHNFERAAELRDVIIELNKN